jgi:hypothetical protein
MYFNKKGRIKLAIALAKGKKQYDKARNHPPPGDGARDPRGGEEPAGIIAGRCACETLHPGELTSWCRCSIWRRSTHRFARDILAAITRVCDSQRFILGPKSTRWNGVRGHAGSSPTPSHVIGHGRLLGVLMALGIGPGDEVITPTFSFFATAGCVSRVGATPVFVDIDPVTFNVEPEAIVERMSPAHQGHPAGASVRPVRRHGCDSGDGRAANVPVIEDAAQAIGARIGTRQAGSWAWRAASSFFPSKNLGAFGDAGLVTTNDRRWRRSCAGAQSRRRAEVLPLAHRRQFPARCAASGGAARESAAPGRMDGRARANAERYRDCSHRRA